MNDNHETIVEALVERIKMLKIELRVKDYEIDNLKQENAKLNEFLNPTKREGEKDE